MTFLKSIIDTVAFDPCRNDIFTLAFFVLALMLALIWRSFLVVLMHKARELVFSHNWRTFEAENVNSGPRLRFFLVIINLSSISIFFYQINRYTEVREVSYFHLVLVVVALHALRIFVTKCVELIFKLKDLNRMWLESYVWIHYVLGVLFLPMAVLMTYSPLVSFSICANLTFVFFILAELLLIYRLFTVFYSGIASLFYLFLYLCTLEILPLLIVSKILS